MGNAVARLCLRLAFAGAVASMVGVGACRNRDDGAANPRPVDGAPAPARPAGMAREARKIDIPWISDDYAGARSRARAEKKPIFIDMWAPWCHTCLSMKQMVMVDPSLGPFVERFVWLEVDTDRPVNAALLTRLQVDVWPTFYVLSPEAESVQARHLGAASIGQLRELLTQGEAGHQDAMAASGQVPAGSLLALVRAGDSAAAAGDMAAADKAYAQALLAAPADWPRTADLLVKQIAARHRGGDHAGCAELGMRESQRAAQGKTASVTDFAYYADACAGALEEPAARLLRGRLMEAVRAVVDAPDSALSIDDESDALFRLRELADKLGDAGTARAMAVRQAALLDRAVAEAPTALGRMTYVWPRAEVYVYLGEGEKLVPDLERLEADLPREYDPPYRLAWLNLQIGRLDEALAAAERAVRLVYGPRKGRALTLVAEIHKARGDVKAERSARQAAVDFYAALPAGHKSEKAEEAARAALAEVGKPAAARREN